jgi:hypothetical protein
MSFISDVFDSVIQVVSDAIGGVKDAVATIATTLATIGYAISEFIADMRAILNNALGSVLPEQVAEWMSLEWFLIDTAAAYGAGFLQNIANAIRSGKLTDIFDVVSPAVAVAIRDARKQARASSLPIPPHILAMIRRSADRNFLTDVARYTTIARLDGDKRFFFVWNKFKGNTSAITLMDTIVFVDPPDFQDPDDQFLILHELKHVLQFEALGVERFIQEYLQERISSGDVPSFEREADLYACSILPFGRPHYIGACPMRLTTLKRMTKVKIPPLKKSRNRAAR